MNKEKLATAGCIILSIAFSLTIGLFVHFKLFAPFVQGVYEKSIDYPEVLYEEYQKEAERMIEEQDCICKYPAQITNKIENGQITLIIEIGEYDKEFTYSNSLTATVKNFGTDEQEVIFKKSRESKEEEYKSAETYRNNMKIFTAVFVLVLVAFTVRLIIKSIKRRYSEVLLPIISFSVAIAFCALVIPLLVG